MTTTRTRTLWNYCCMWHGCKVYVVSQYINMTAVAVLTQGEQNCQSYSCRHLVNTSSVLTLCQTLGLGLVAILNESDKSLEKQDYCVMPWCQAQWTVNKLCLYLKITFNFEMKLVDKLFCFCCIHWSFRNLWDFQFPIDKMIDSNCMHFPSWT